MSSASAPEKASRTARWAYIMTRWRIGFVTNGRQVGAKKLRPAKRWNLVAFPGRAGGESTGVVDLIAIRRDHKTVKGAIRRGDLFEIILIQVKGGQAHGPTSDDRRRLRTVAAHYRAKAVLLAAWRLGKQPQFSRLSGNEWKPVDPGDVFR
jgi:hypothetical protein